MLNNYNNGGAAKCNTKRLTTSSLYFISLYSYLFILKDELFSNRSMYRKQCFKPERPRGQSTRSILQAIIGLSLVQFKRLNQRATRTCQVPQKTWVIYKWFWFFSPHAWDDSCKSKGTRWDVMTLKQSKETRWDVMILVKVKEHGMKVHV